jgi:hypothetical protein
MELPREVMDDLMVLYLGGEASAETRRLVEEYAAQHEDFRALLEQAEAPILPAAPAKDKEMETLKMTRQFIVLRSAFLAAAILFTLLPLTSVYRKGALTFLMYRDLPGTGPAFWSVAAASWVACYVMHRSVKKAGL